MKTRLSSLILLLLSLTFTSRAQVNPSPTTNFVWVTPLPAEPLALAADGPRGAYVLLKGNTLVQLDTRGREQWRQTLPATWPTVKAIATSPDGRLLVAGEFTGQFTIGDSTYRLSNIRQTSVFVAQFDSTHARRWATYVLTPGGLMSQFNSLAAEPQGDALVFGRQAGVNIPVLCRFDADGRFLAATRYGAPTIPAPEAVLVVADSKGDTRLAIAERTQSSTSALFLATTDDAPRWQKGVNEALGTNAARRYDTTPLDLALDGQDNLVALSKYTLVDRLTGLVAETGQALLRYDADGKNLWVKTGVSRPDSALATGVLADPAGAIVAHGGYSGPFDPPTGLFGPADYVSLAGYAPDGSLRWTTRVNAPTGNDRLTDVVRGDNGALFLAGRTTGTLPLGTFTATGTAASPAHYLALLQPFVLRPTSATVLCAGSNTTLRGNYAGYFEQSISLQLSDANGRFDAPRTLGSIPIGVAGNLFNVSSFAVSVPLSTTLAPSSGYRLRAVSPLPAYVGEAVSVTVAVAPTAPTLTQTGDELVASPGAAGTTYQWFTNNREAVAGATAVRFKPPGTGAYYVVATAGSCSSTPSEALNFIITANEAPPAETFDVFPNPATDRFQVRATTTPATLTLTDLTGRQVRSQPTTGRFTDVPVVGLQPGLYLLRLEGSGQPAQIRKMLIR